MPIEQVKEDLLKRIRSKRRRLETFVTQLDRSGARLTTVSIVCGAAVAILNGSEMLGAQKLSPALRWVVPGTAALISLAGAAAAGVYKFRDTAARLAKTQECGARLEGIEMLVEVGQLDVREAVLRFEKCLAEIAFVPSDVGMSRLKGPPSPETVSGVISNPQKGDVVDDTFDCLGSAEGLVPGLHLWLATEIEGRIWPKEGQVIVNDSGLWKKTVCEEGAAAKFSISLFSADEEGHRQIRNWFESCESSGSYTELRKPPGMIRLARVDGLCRRKTLA
jgi:hypothetical protein